ncbi:MAG: sulfite exporter TauE/SafE [Lentimonas sp.]|jgi:sulfite exporter TauE/SafE
MCGPFVLNQVGNRLGNIKINQVTTFKKLQGLTLLPYHFGRISTYCLITFFSASISQNLKNSPSFKQLAGLLLIIGVLVIFNSTIAKIKLPFKMPQVLRIKKINFINNFVSYLFANPVGFKSYLLGIILGFLPCGLVYGAILSALALENSLISTLAVLAFGIGTIPALFLTACGGYWLFNGANKYSRIFIKIILAANILTLLIMAFSLMFNKI